MGDAMDFEAAPVPAAVDEQWIDDVMYCARAGEIDDLRMLLGQSGNPGVNKVVNEARTSALHYAAANGHVECILALIEAGARSTMNSSNNSPLHWAIVNRQVPAALALIAKDPSVNVLAQNAQGKSCSTLAFETSEMHLIKAVLEHPSAAPLEQPSEQGDGGEDQQQQQHSTLVLGFLRDLNECTPTLSIREVGVRPTTLEQLALGSLEDTGCTVWSASIVLARWLLSRPTELKNKSVLELGAGCGVPGLAAFWCPTSEFRASRVCLTDLGGISFENLKYNADQTRKRGTKRKKDMPSLSVVELDWTNQETWPPNWLGTTDVLLGSDIVYDPGLVGPLVETCSALLRPGGVLLHVAAKNNRAGMDVFVGAMADAGLSIVSEEEAPALWRRNPLKDQDEDMFALRFDDMTENGGFILREFRRMA